MRALFDETVISGMKLRNRLVRSATWEGMCGADGRPSAKLAACYSDLARGGVGLIVTGYSFIRPDGKQLPGKMGIHTDDFLPELSDLARAVHDEGGAICMQLVHAGGQTDSATAGRRPLAPSAVQVEQFPEVPEALTSADIRALVTCFGNASRRAKSAGFDAVQLHAAHGYLINQFLSPLTNLRTDDYGGGIANRCRFLLEVYDAVRAAVGEGYPVLVKLNGADNLTGGLTLEDAAYAAKALDARGIAAIEVSGGTPASGDQSPVRQKIDSPAAEAYNLPLARGIRAAVRCPVMVVGGFRSLEVAERAITDEGMEYISMSRPFIREPDLAKRWKNCDQRPATCISCNGCFKPGLREGGIYCAQERKERQRG